MRKKSYLGFLYQNLLDTKKNSFLDFRKKTTWKSFFFFTIYSQF